MRVSWPLAFGGAFQPNLTGLDNLKFICRIYGQESDMTERLERIQAFAEQARFELVETFAERLVATLMDEFHIPWVRLKLTKPGAVPAARGGVGVEIERGCL